MPSKRACWRPNTRASRGSWSQLPNDPQETEAFLRRIFWLDQKI